ncbi:MAG: hypothetical protein QNK03_17265 [Myxococcota bacterium]|nr:hypothetical protein [Myxococcota bacterium]
MVRSTDNAPARPLRPRVVCAWCERPILGSRDGRRRPVSHGLCRPCAQRLAQRAARPSVSGRS